MFKEIGIQLLRILALILFILAIMAPLAALSGCKKVDELIHPPKATLIITLEPIDEMDAETSSEAEDLFDLEIQQMIERGE